jgi:hypothetical protein
MGRFTGEIPYFLRFRFFPCFLHTVGVTGSNPVSSTTWFSIKGNSSTNGILSHLQPDDLKKFKDSPVAILDASLVYGHPGCQGGDGFYADSDKNPFSLPGQSQSD